MKNHWGRWLVISSIILLAVSMSAFAQSSSLLAFINSSGQLVVSSGDGGYRWIVTNPGETLVNGYMWAGDQLVYAVYDGGEISVRAADVNAQNAYEIGRGAGGWITFGGVSDAGVVVAFDDRLAVFALNGSGGGEIGASGTINERAADGGAIFMRGNDGAYALVSGDGSLTPLGFANDPNAPFVNLWSGSRVAYADFGIGSPLNVTDANSGVTVTLNGDGSIPLIPLAWADSRLIYRGTGGVIRIADMSGMNGGANPLENSADLLSGSASGVITDGEYAYFIAGDTVGALDLACVNRGDCLNSAQIIGTSAAPEMPLSVGGGVLIYTGYSGSPYDRAGWDVRVIDLGCLGGDCQPFAVTGGAAGALSPDGAAVIAQDANGGLSAIGVRDGGAAALSDGGDLALARWAA